MNVVVNKADSSDLRDLVVLTCEFLEDVASQAGMAGFVPDDQKIREKLPEFLDMPDYAVFVARSPKGHPFGCPFVLVRPKGLEPPTFRTGI